MECEILKEQESITLKIVGRIDTITSPNLEKQLNELVEQTNKLVLNFEKVDYISSAGLRVLLMIQKKCNQDKKEFVISNVNETVMDVFEMTGFSNILKIE